MDFSLAVKPPGLENSQFRLDTTLYNPCQVRVAAPRGPALGEQSMKRAVRMLFLMVGMICAYTALAAPIVPEDGAPIPKCTGRGCR